MADVERYPEFLPLCTGLRVRRRVPVGEGVETLVAEMGVGYKAITETFTTKVTLDRPKLDIHVSYVDGPFKYLENHWSFRPDGEGCRVEVAAVGLAGASVELLAKVKGNARNQAGTVVAHRRQRHVRADGDVDR